MYYIGQGTDTHKLEKNAKSKGVIFGGVVIKTEYHVVAVSDGDVVYHSIANAMLGALQLGDIGDYFNDKDSNNKGLDSKKIIEFVLEKLAAKKMVLVNIDLTIVCENIMLNPHKKEIAKNLMKILDCKKINVKATRYERPHDFVGCESIVLIREI